MELKNLGKGIFITLVVVSVILSIFYMYIHFFVNDYTLGINNINDQVALDIVNSDELSDEQKDEYEDRWFMEANFYSNANENGIVLQELRYNYFTTYNLQSNDYRSTGMQYLGEYESSVINVGNEEQANEGVRNEFYYYDTTNDITWSGYRGQYGSIGTKLNRNEVMIIKIDNRTFGIQLTGQYSYTYREHKFAIPKKITVVYEYGDVFDAVMHAIKSASIGYGDYYLTIDLTDYFTIQEYDTESGQFKEDNVTDIIKNYAVVKVHYDENGAKNANQSIYGSIACDPKYGQADTDYWQSRFVYNLTDNMLTYRYSDAYQGYFVGLSFDTRNTLLATELCDINIIIDIDTPYITNNNYNILGIDYDAFSGLEIDTLTIISEQPTTIRLLDRCLYNTSIKQIIRSASVTLDISDNAINNEYEEVVL